VVLVLAGIGFFYYKGTSGGSGSAANIEKSIQAGVAGGSGPGAPITGPPPGVMPKPGGPGGTVPMVGTPPGVTPR
jgi:hypothetical protein